MIFFGTFSAMSVRDGTFLKVLTVEVLVRPSKALDVMRGGDRDRRDIWRAAPASECQNRLRFLQSTDWLASNTEIDLFSHVIYCSVQMREPLTSLPYSETSESHSV